MLSSAAGHVWSSDGAHYLEVFVEADYGSGSESQREEVGQRKPEPELGKDQQAYD